MNPQQNVKTLVKILIGTAWLDGKIQPEERQYLQQIATEKGVADDLEIQPLLYEFRAVKPDECYEWVREYLGDRPSSETCQNLIEAISALIYRDGTIATEEAKLLARLQLLDSSSDSESIFDKVLTEIRKLYQRGMSKL
ncbi:TerB family tellurite resistance protein [Phormidesmis sp. 146-35]